MTYSPPILYVSRTVLQIFDNGVERIFSKAGKVYGDFKLRQEDESLEALRQISLRLPILSDKGDRL